MNKDLDKSQNDYALFLPAISGAYASKIGNQRISEHVPYKRMPKGLQDMEMLNFFDKKKGAFYYPYGLFSAGQAVLDLNKNLTNDAMFHTRDRDVMLVADSGGYQIGRGRWEADWPNPKCPKAQKYREQALKWLNAIGNYSMVLDVPIWTTLDKDSADATNVHSYQDAVDATIINNDYFMKHSEGGTKFLNVLQGSTHTESDKWYNDMKHYNDPAKHEKPFEGWALGGTNAADYHLLLRRIITLISDGLLNEGENDWIHVLGIGKLTHAVILTEIQRAIRKHHNPNLTISFDAASPFLTTVNGGIYTGIRTNTKGKWSYISEGTIDDKKLTKDTRKFSTATIQDGIHKSFIDSPISDKLLVKDICVYTDKCLNKQGNQGKTAWDTFSYVLIMGHNVWCHINAIQEANRQYDNGVYPSTLVQPLGKAFTFKDVIEELFNEKDINKQYAILDKYSKFFLKIDGVKGFGGKKSNNANTIFGQFF